MRVPFTDLRSPGDIAAMASINAIGLMTQTWVGGSMVEAFEEAWAEYTGARYCVSCANGSEAVELAVRALGWHGPRSVSASTFIATAEGMVRGGCEPYVVDVDPRTLLADSGDLDVSVGLHGQLGPSGTIVDAAQCHGATRDGRRHIGTLMTWSGYVTKPLGAWGDAGWITTDDGDLAQRIRDLANHAGGPGSGNSRLDAIQAAVLLVKLPHLDAMNAQRTGAALYYHHLLEGLAESERVILPGRDMRSTHVWHIYAIRVDGNRRDEVLERLHAAGVDARVHYRWPIHLWPKWDLPGRAPVAAKAADEMISLPLWAGISAGQQEYVSAMLTEALD